MRPQIVALPADIVAVSAAPIVCSILLALSCVRRVRVVMGFGYAMYNDTLDPSPCYSGWKESHRGR